MEQQTYESWEIHIKEELAQSDEYQLLDLTQDTLIRLACSLGDAKTALRADERQDYVLYDLKRRIARVAVLMDVLQLRYGDAADEEEAFLKDIESCLE